MIMDEENIKCEFINSSDNADNSIHRDFDMTVSIEHETFSIFNKSKFEDKTAVKCEYLEFEDEMSDTNSSTSTNSKHFIQEDRTNYEKKRDINVHDKLSKLGKHEDLFIVIVEDKKKTKKKRSKVVQKKYLRKCEPCDKYFSSTYFSEHTKRVHGDKKKKAVAAQIRSIKQKLKSTKVQCQICQKVVSQRNFKAHFATHDLNKSKYICDKCGKAFAQRRLLVIHMVTHSTEFKFECKLCSYKGRSSNLLRMHIMHKHIRDYKYTCKECPAKFLTKSSLNQHSHIHIYKEPMFTCQTCKKRFKLKHTLERHIEANHLGIKRYICNLCGEAFGYKKGLIQHQVKVHKKEKNLRGRIPLYLKAEA